MNIIDIILIVILAISLFAGMKKGFVGSVLAILGFVASWLGARYLYPLLLGKVMENASLINTLSDRLNISNWLSGALSNMSVQGLSGANLDAAVNQVGSKVSFLADTFRENVANQNFAELGRQTLGEYLDVTVLQGIGTIASFLLCFIVCYIIASLLVNLLSRVFRFPALRHLDWLLGGVFGLVRGYAIALLVLTLLPALSGLLGMPVITDMVDQSKILTYAQTLDVFNIRSWIAALLK